MKLRIELLRNMSDQSWTVVVNTVLSREGDKSWEKGRDVLREHGVDWLRDRLVKEGKELVKRYDQLLPVEPRKWVTSLAFLLTIDRIERHPSLPRHQPQRGQ